MTQTLDEVLRHAVREIAAAVDETYTRRARGKKHRRLTRGVASADYYDLLIFATPRLKLGRCIVEPCTLEAILLRHSELAVTGSSCDHHRPPK